MQSARAKHYVVAPPPTPNGDLHVGHISGPYLAADVMSRYYRLRNESVTFAISVDSYQSYVETKARQLQCEPHDLIQRNHDCITQTLRTAQISSDIVGLPDKRYRDFILDFFRRLYDRGVLVKVERQYGYSQDCDEYLVEGYVKGLCPTCFARSRANLCEQCGHPNDPVQLTRPQALADSQPRDAYPLRTLWTLELELEQYRDRIWSYLRGLPELRPTLSRLINELFATKLANFPITHPLSWGIQAPFEGLSGMVLNAWAEIYPGHLYWLAQADGSGDAPLTDRFPQHYTQFMGFDNVYFYAIAHVGLAFAARDAGIEAPLPSAIIPNEFYLYQHEKFSTGRNHLIWARDLFGYYPSDHIRFFLCWSNPERQSANFETADFERITREKLLLPLQSILGSARELANSRAPLAPNRQMQPLYAGLRQRFEQACEARSPSLRLATQTLLNVMALLQETRAQLTAEPREQHAGHYHTLLTHLALFAAPIMPDLSQQLWKLLGFAGNPQWTVPALPAAWPACDQDTPASAAERSSSCLLCTT